MAARHCTVRDFVGRRGSQDIYSVNCEGPPQHLFRRRGTVCAMNAYQTKLRTMVEGAPAVDGFVWPKWLVEVDDGTPFGFLNDPRPVGWSSLADVLCRRAPLTESLRVAVGLNLCNQWAALHDAGWCFLDFDPEDVLIDPESGGVLHWITESHVARLDSSESLPHPSRFTWPVVARAEESFGTRADHFTLATILFMLLVRRHPYEGSQWLLAHCLDQAKTRQVYWEHPRFMFGPGSEADSLPTGIDDDVATCWGSIPLRLKNLFRRALSAHVPIHSPRDVPISEWRREFTTLQDSLYPCAKCRRELFFDSAADCGRELECPHCGSLVKPVLTLKIASCLIVLHPEKRILKRHLEPSSTEPGLEVMAQVTRHPTDPDRWGLRNLGESSWQVTMPPGAELELAHGKSVTLTPGLQINFGNELGQVDLGPALSRVESTRDQVARSLPREHPENPDV